MLGQHAIKHWSSTQSSISLSSGEAEFAGVIRGARQGLGYQALLRDLGVEAPLRVWTDSSAAIGICSRPGLGKMRHLDTHTLWIQQAVRTGRVDLRKVPGDQNPADLLTKHSLTRARMDKLVSLFGCYYLGGRAESAPLTRTGASGKTTMADMNTRDIGAIQGNTADTDGSADPSGTPVMPHLVHDAPTLDALYPPLRAVHDELLEDLETDLADGVLQKGMTIAREISSETARFGRRRRAPEPSGAISLVNGPNNDEKLREGSSDAPEDSSSWRRRSAKSSPLTDTLRETTGTSGHLLRLLRLSEMPCMRKANFINDTRFTVLAVGHLSPLGPRSVTYRQALRDQGLDISTGRGEGIYLSRGINTCSLAPRRDRDTRITNEDSCGCFLFYLS